MASQKQNPLRIIGEQIQSLMPAQRVNPQKEVEGAKVLESFEMVPEAYQEFFRPLLSRGETFPYTVMTPAYEVPGEIITEKLMCAIEHTFYVLEAGENELTKVCYPIDEIYYVEVIHRPADLRVKINGLTNLGLASISVFGCSRSTSNLLAPLFQRIRLRIVSLNDQAPSRHVERLDRLEGKNSQVIEMAKHCLMPGETVIEAVLQPEIKPGLFSPDRVLRGTKCATHVCILTDKELAIIREDPSQGSKDQGSIICNFIPLNKIHSLVVTQEKDHLLTVSIRILNGEVIESLFDVSLQKEVNQFLEETYERMPREKAYRRD